MIERYSRPDMKWVWSDESKFSRWLQVEIAVAEAWAEAGMVPQEALPPIRAAGFSLERMDQILKETHHDVTAFLRAVGETVGEESRFIHFGLTSSDVIDTALGLQLMEAAALLSKGVDGLVKVLVRQALEHRDTIMMGRTHGVHAEPTTLGLKLALWVEEMKRHQVRLEEARRQVSVGKISGAVGTHATVPLDVEESACRRLGLEPAAISSQIVQRDRHAQFVVTLALIGCSLEKLATEIRGLQRTEVREVEEPFEPGQTGSSAMPHKRNPELCERICGLSRLLRGFSVTAMENIALWHERDISHSSTERIILPDSCLALDYMLHLATYVIGDLLVYPDRMRHNLELTRGLIFSQRVMLTLIEKGLGREQAYKAVQGHAMATWQGGDDFLSRLKADPEVTTTLPPGELEALFDYGYFVRRVGEIFQRLSLGE
ncbi:MAG: adenylosuccinate lyase [Dehalococcoidia bacterium]|jgi:adenylosuccinate lyase|nr:adenylosuccinate lyase [Dehalococcoidia bacterium]